MKQIYFRFSWLPPSDLSEQVLSPPAKKYSSMMAYNNAKLCNVLFARGLAKVWKSWYLYELMNQAIKLRNSLSATMFERCLCECFASRKHGFIVNSPELVVLSGSICHRSTVHKILGKNPKQICQTVVRIIKVFFDF